MMSGAPSGDGQLSVGEGGWREDSRLEATVTFPTRAMRTGETQGNTYYFVNREELEIRIKE